MPDPPRQDCVHPDVGAYALGLLEPDELAEYERHLLRCARCNRLLAELAPLVEMLDRVDAPSLLAATGMGRPLPRPPEPTTPPEPRAITKGARRLTLTAAATAVLVLVGFVTFVARSSEQGPAFTAGEVPAASTTTPPGTEPALEPDKTVDRPAATASPAPPRPASPTPVRPGRTGSGSPPADGEPGPAIRVGPGPSGPHGGTNPRDSPQRYAGADPATGATATVDVTGAGLALTLTGVSGPCDCALVAYGDSGLRETALRWQLPPGGTPYTATGTIALDGIDHFEVVDSTGTVIVTLSSR